MFTIYNNAFGCGMSANDHFLGHNIIIFVNDTSLLVAPTIKGGTIPFVANGGNANPGFVGYYTWV